MELISMTDYVLEVTRENDKKIVSSAISYKLLKQLESIQNYVNFLKQPLTLGMFVPCDDDGNVLEEPSWQVEFEKGKVTAINLIEKSKQYQQAKSKVLFEGFEVGYKSNVSICVENENFDIRFKKDGTIDSFRFRIIEHLVCRNPTLSQSAINQLK